MVNKLGFCLAVVVFSSVLAVSGLAQTDPIGQWEFDGNGDSAVGKWWQNVSLVGNAEFKSSGGHSGGYLYVPADGDYAKITYDPAFDLPDTFTIEFWFRQRSDQSFLQALVYKGSATNNYNFYIFRQLWNQYNNGPVIAGHTASNTGYWTQPSNNNDMAHGEWHHVVFTKGTEIHAYYLDGVQIGSKNVTIYTEYSGPAKTPAVDIIIGDSAVDTDFDELKIYDRALSYSEVRMNGGFPPTTTSTSTTTTTVPPTTTTVDLNNQTSNQTTTTVDAGSSAGNTAVDTSSDQTITLDLCGDGICEVTETNDLCAVDCPYVVSEGTMTTTAPETSTGGSPSGGSGIQVTTTSLPPIATTTPRAFCSDSDDGISVYTRGIATSVDGEIFEDSCVGNDVMEYYCQNNEVISYTTVCGNGCDDGACVSGLSNILQQILDFFRSLFGM